MIRVGGFWELGYSAPLTEYDLWSFMLRDFGVESWSMCPVSGIYAEDLTEYHRPEELIAAHPDCVPVYVDEKGETDLEDFVHPENAFYILGKASFSPLVFAEGAQSVRICTQENKALLWPHQAIAIVLYDRMRKSWQ